MRHPFSGERAKLSLVAIASVATVSLLTFLASTRPDQLLTPETASTPPIPRFELRGAPAEPVEPVPREEPGATVGAAAVGAPLQADPTPAFRAEEAPSAPPATIERAVASDAAAVSPKARRKASRWLTDAGVLPVRRPVAVRAAPKPASEDALPNKKGPDVEEPDADAPRDPLFDFIGGF